VGSFRVLVPEWWLTESVGWRLATRVVEDRREGFRDSSLGGSAKGNKRRGPESGLVDLGYCIMYRPWSTALTYMSDQTRRSGFFLGGFSFLSCTTHVQ
jgi:hypothetical protein